MAWKFESDRPIYTQLLEQIELKIISGEYKPGSRLKSVRELAAEAAVNPNTMQKALVKLEENGLIITSRSVGRTVTEDTGLIEETKQMTARKYTAEYVTKMRQLGMSVKECSRSVEEMEIKDNSEE